MVQRAVTTQRCTCGWRTYSKAEMAEHIEEVHGGIENKVPTFTSRVKDQKEFKPQVLMKTPWGSELQ